MPVQHLQRGLQRVVVGDGAGLNLVDVVERNIDERADGVGGIALLAVGNRLAVAAVSTLPATLLNLVEVAEVEEVAALRADVADLESNRFWRAATRC